MTSEPVVMHSNTMHLIGKGVRTSNALEMDAATAQIGGLWQQFYADGITDNITGQSNPGVIFGVYSDYESDVNGMYTLSVALETEAGTPAPEGFNAIEIPPATFLVFSAEGPVPQATIGLWQEIWQYFEQHTETPRAYDYDFELYSAEQPDKVDIYISIKA